MLAVDLPIHPVAAPNAEPHANRPVDFKVDQVDSSAEGSVSVKHAPCTPPLARVVGTKHPSPSSPEKIAPFIVRIATNPAKIIVTPIAADRAGNLNEPDYCESWEFI